MHKVHGLGISRLDGGLDDQIEELVDLAVSAGSDIARTATGDVFSTAFPGAREMLKRQLRSSLRDEMAAVVERQRVELVAKVAGKAGTSQAAVNSVLDALFEVFETSVAAGEKITIPGWLAVERTDRAARTGRNPQTGETIPIAAGHSVKLTAGSKLKAAADKTADKKE